MRRPLSHLTAKHIVNSPVDRTTLHISLSQRSLKMAAALTTNSLRPCQISCWNLYSVNQQTWINNIRHWAFGELVNAGGLDEEGKVKLSLWAPESQSCWHCRAPLWPLLGLWETEAQRPDVKLLETSYCGVQLRLPGAASRITQSQQFTSLHFKYRLRWGTR